MTIFDMKKAIAKADAIKRAKEDLTGYLEQHFPAGARCGVMLSCAQKTPTPAAIYGACGNDYGGTITVVIDSAKTRTRFPFRRVSPDCVFNVHVEDDDGAQQDKGASDGA